MRIFFERSGGFTGMLVQAEIEPDMLSVDELVELRTLVAEADFFNLPSDLAGSTGADRFEYVVTVEDGAATHTVRTGDEGAPPELQPLLRRLTVLARRAPGS